MNQLKASSLRRVLRRQKDHLIKNIHHLRKSIVNLMNKNPLLKISMKVLRELVFQMKSQRRKSLIQVIREYGQRILVLRISQNNQRRRKNKSYKMTMTLRNNLMSIWKSRERMSNLRWRSKSLMSSLESKSRNPNQNKLLKIENEAHIKSKNG